MEDVVGFALPVVRWVPGWYGCAFGLPDRHPRLFAWRDSMPVVPGGPAVCRRDGVAVRGGLRTG